MNASRTTFTTDISGSFPSTQSRNSVDGDCRQSTCTDTMPKTQVQLPGPFEARKGSWTSSSESARRSTVNDRIREWAKKSFSFARMGSEQSEGGDFGHHHAGRGLPKSVVVNSPSDTTKPDTCASPDKYRQSVGGITQVKSPT